MAKNNILVRSKVRQAAAFLKQNKLPEAVKLYEKICQQDRSNGELWSTLGTLKRRVGQYGEAERCCRMAIQLSPKSAPAYQALGSVFHAQGRLDEAVMHYRKAMELKPDYGEAHYYLANAFREGGNLDAAVHAYNRLLQLDPDHIEGLNNYGALLTNTGKSEQAIKLLSHALEIKNDSIETMSNLARAHTLVGSQRSAIELLSRAIALRPKFLDAHLELANALHLDGQYDKAIHYFDRALEFAPANRRAMVGKARVYAMLGRNDEAYSLIRPLLEKGAADEALSVFFEISQSLGLRDKAVSLIQRRLEKKSTNIPGSAALHFKLGKYFDAEQNYDVAFEHFAKGNALSQKTFDLEAAALQFDTIRQTYHQKFVENMPYSTNTSELPIFIVGMPRSGTSLVEQIFASHPGIHGAGETENIRQSCDGLAAQYSVARYPDFVPKLSQAILDRTSAGIGGKLSALSPESKRITDKMPHNFLYIGLILQLFPGCRIIHCTRHPLDTCLSCYFSEFGSITHNYAYELNTLGRYYGLYSKLMKHWATVFPGRIYRLVYEELIEDQERSSRSMLAHCGMEWNERCLDFHKLDRVVHTISYNQVRQPLYNRSVNRWNNYDNQLQGLRDALDQSGVEY